MERVTFLIEDTGEQLSCLMNPERVVLRRTSGLVRQRSLGAELDGATDDLVLRTGGGSTEVELDLLFDLSLGSVDATAPAEDVRELTGALWRLTEKSESGCRAATARLIWGRCWNMRVVVDALAERLEEFTPFGAARRSWLRVRLLRIEEEAPRSLEDVQEALPAVERDAASGGAGDALAPTDEGLPGDGNVEVVGVDALQERAALDSGLWELVAELQWAAAGDEALEDGEDGEADDEAALDEAALGEAALDAGEAGEIVGGGNEDVGDEGEAPVEDTTGEPDAHVGGSTTEPRDDAAEAGEGTPAPDDETGPPVLVADGAEGGGQHPAASAAPPATSRGAVTPEPAAVDITTTLRFAEPRAIATCVLVVIGQAYAEEGPLSSASRPGARGAMPGQSASSLPASFESAEMAARVPVPAAVTPMPAAAVVAPASRPAAAARAAPAAAERARSAPSPASPVPASAVALAPVRSAPAVAAPAPAPTASTPAASARSAPAAAVPAGPLPTVATRGAPGAVPAPAAPVASAPASAPTASTPAAPGGAPPAAPAAAPRPEGSARGASAQTAATAEHQPAPASSVPASSASTSAAARSDAATQPPAAPLAARSAPAPAPAVRLPAVPAPPHVASASVTPSRPMAVASGHARRGRSQVTRAPMRRRLIASERELWDGLRRYADRLEHLAVDAVESARLSLQRSLRAAQRLGTDDLSALETWVSMLCSTEDPTPFERPDGALDELRRTVAGLWAQGERERARRLAACLEQADCCEQQMRAALRAIEEDPTLVLWRDACRALATTGVRAALEPALALPAAVETSPRVAVYKLTRLDGDLPHALRATLQVFLEGAASPEAYSSACATACELSRREYERRLRLRRRSVFDPRTLDAARLRTRRLDLAAQRRFGNPGEWRRLAEARPGAEREPA